MYCKNCGAELDSKALVCLKCGYHVRKLSLLGKLIIVVSCLAVVAVGVVAAIFIKNNNSDESNAYENSTSYNQSQMIESTEETTEATETTEITETTETTESTELCGDSHDYVNGICSVCEDLQTKGLEYTRCDNDGYYMVTGIGTCTDAEVFIPERYNGIEVIGIGDFAFSDCTSLKKINIPESVTSIGKSAFSGCKSLKDITIPNSVTDIGYCAFVACTSLESILIPDSVISVGDQLFNGCKKLNDVYCEAEEKPSGWSEYWSVDITGTCKFSITWGK